MVNLWFILQNVQTPMARKRKKVNGPEAEVK
jgi:hypothetical protein